MSNRLGYAASALLLVLGLLALPAIGPAGAAPPDGKGWKKSTTTTSTTTTTVASEDDAEVARADDRHLVLAAYYPWFHEERYDDPTLADRPTEPSDVYEYDDVLRMTQQARDHGIDGFIVSWMGAKRNGFAFDLVLDAAAATGGLATAYLETQVANADHDPTQPADPDVVKTWLYQAVIRAGETDAFLEKDGVPVVFVYAMRRLPAEDWEQILAEFDAAGLPVKLVGDGGGDHAEVRWGWHRYAINELSAEQLENSTRWVVDYSLTMDPVRLSVGTVSPGYDDTNLRGDTNEVVERGPNGERYAEVWEAIIRADPDWVFVNSWNEWLENTQVQPGELTGDLALRQTAYYSAEFKASASE